MTIGPFLFLGFLGVTYRVGSRPAKPCIVDEPVAKRSGCPSRALGGTGREYQIQGSGGDTVADTFPISRHDSSRSTVNPKPDQCVPPNATVVSAIGCGAPKMDTNRQTSLVVRVGDEGTETGQTLSPATNHTGGPNKACSMWQAASKSDPKQVGLKKC